LEQPQLTGIDAPPTNCSLFLPLKVVPVAEKPAHVP
jgi:hypothetical protein